MATRLVTTTESETFDLEMEDIERIVSRHFEKQGWKLEMGWRISQSATLRVQRSQTVVTEEEVSL